jgi:hypothetical protein
MTLPPGLAPATSRRPVATARRCRTATPASRTARRWPQGARERSSRTPVYQSFVSDSSNLYPQKAGGHEPESAAHGRAQDAAARHFEDLLARHGVDVHLTGHSHQYERTGPVYRYADKSGLPASQRNGSAPPSRLVPQNLALGLQEFVW